MHTRLWEVLNLDSNWILNGVESLLEQTHMEQMKKELEIAEDQLKDKTQLLDSLREKLQILQIEPDIGFLVQMRWILYQ